jgi:hypothetical protein
MATRTQAQAIDGLAEQIRIRNLIEVMKLGNAALDEAIITAKTSPETAKRQQRMNEVRREIKALLRIEVQS